MILGRSPVTFENGMGPSPCATSSYVRALAQGPDIGCRDRGRKGAPSLEIGAQHDLVVGSEAWRFWPWKGRPTRRRQGPWHAGLARECQTVGDVWEMSGV